MKSCVEARTPAKLSTALLDLNGDYDYSIKEPTSNQRWLTTGLAVFIRLALKARVLSHYSGHRLTTDLMNHAASFILVPKRVTSICTNKMEGYVKIGNLIFESPSDSIWTEAKSIDEEMSDIVSHITLEQRAPYITAFNRVRSLTAVRDCAIRQENIDTSACVADIVQRSKNPNVVTLAHLNKWRRSFYTR